MKETYVTIEQQWCCATLTTVEDILLSFARELFKFRKCCRILTANLENNENKVSFGTLLPCSLSKQANKISKGNSQSLFAKLTLKSSVAMPCIEIPAQSLINIFSTPASVTQHH